MSPLNPNFPKVRPRRTMLYVSGDNPRHLEKSRELPADALVFDLHESTAMEHKARARDNVVAAVAAGNFIGQELVVRPNPLNSERLAEDLDAIAALPIDAVLFSGINTRADMLKAVAMLDAAGGERLPVMIMVESPLAVMHLEEILTATRRLSCVVVSTANLCNGLRINVTPDRTGLLTILSLVVLAARAHNVGVIDGAHVEVNDAKGCEFACRQARDLGFDGKAVIHPVQLPYTNDTFTPKPKEVEKKRAIITAMQDAEAEGRPYAVLDGRLLQPVELEAAQRCIAMFEAIEEREQAFNLCPGIYCSTQQG
ncbi:HpcH/HpaI aldolase/citrate lyase family protein [Thioalbus denitrificans]|uniref:Citrate lyase subunit beta/citryl-CoA lyase n=1 Tax=Thioalbus denitrificans TaxID=547122 RepID=A0A369BWI6_9GAMM|nr:CoA ester lyase [Thioalbus denitrificans]RCX26052.1 citrate lyase subunit beta/citryl-CoA lyase [Thioalbus denitrificans]